MDHSYCQQKTYFNGQEENLEAPLSITSDYIIENGQKRMSFIENDGIIGSRYDPCNESVIKRLCILYKLPYFKDITIRRTVDFMHIEKNISDNIVGTLLNIEGSTKETDKAREDLEDMNIRSQFWLKLGPNKGTLKPFCTYVLMKDEAKLFYDYVRTVKLPDGYGSNIAQRVTDNNKLFGMKSHDSHVLLQKLLPAGILTLLTAQVRGTLMELSQCFEKLCAKN